MRFSTDASPHFSALAPRSIVPLAKQKLAAEIANGVVFAHNDLLSGKRRGHTTDGAHDFTGDALIAPFTRVLEWFSSMFGLFSFMFTFFIFSSMISPLS